MFPQRRHECVNVIGRDDTFLQAITLSVEMAQSGFHNFPHGRFAQNTFTVTGVEPRLNSLREALVKFLTGGVVVRFRMRGLPLGQFLLPLVEFFLG